MRFFDFEACCPTSVFDLDNNRRQCRREEGSSGIAEIYGDKEIPVLFIRAQLQGSLLAHKIVQEVLDGAS